MQRCCASRPLALVAGGTRGCAAGARRPFSGPPGDGGAGIGLEEVAGHGGDDVRSLVLPLGVGVGETGVLHALGCLP